MATHNNNPYDVFSYDKSLNLLDLRRPSGSPEGYFLADLEKEEKEDPGRDPLLLDYYLERRKFEIKRPQREGSSSIDVEGGADVSKYRNRNDRKSKLMCMLADYKVAPSSSWRLNQPRNGQPQVGWYPSLPERLIHSKDEAWRTEMMTSFQKQARNKGIYDYIRELVEAPHLLSSVEDFNVLLQQSGLAADHATCEQIMRTMGMRKLRPNGDSFFHWMNGCSTAHPKKGLKIFYKIRKVYGEQFMSTKTYNLAIFLLFVTDAPFQSSLDLLREMKESKASKPCPVTYHLVIRSLCKQNEFEKAWEMFQESHDEIYTEMKDLDRRGDDYGKETMNDEKTHCQQDSITCLLQLLKQTKPRIRFDHPAFAKGGRASDVFGISQRGLIFTTDDEDPIMLERRTALAKKLYDRFELLNFDYFALGKVHFTGVSCMAQLLMKSGNLEDVISLYIDYVARHRKTMQYHQKSTIAIHAMEAAVKLADVHRCLEIIKELTNHKIHPFEEEKIEATRQIDNKYGGGNDRGIHKDNGSDIYGDDTDGYGGYGGYGDYGEGQDYYSQSAEGYNDDGYGDYGDRYGNDYDDYEAKEHINPKFLLEGFKLAVAQRQKTVADEILMIMESSMRFSKSKVFLNSLRKQKDAIVLEHEKSENVLSDSF